MASAPPTPPTPRTPSGLPHRCRSLSGAIPSVTSPKTQCTLEGCHTPWATSRAHALHRETPSRRRIDLFGPITIALIVQPISPRRPNRPPSDTASGVRWIFFRISSGGIAPLNLRQRSGNPDGLRAGRTPAGCRAAAQCQLIFANRWGIIIGMPDPIEPEGFADRSRRLSAAIPPDRGEKIPPHPGGVPDRWYETGDGYEMMVIVGHRARCGC